MVGMSIGVIIMSLFGCFWLLWGLEALHQHGWLFALTVLLFVIPLLAAVRISRVARAGLTLAPPPTAEQKAIGHFRHKHLQIRQSNNPIALPASNL